MRAEGEIKEVHLNERRRVPEELDISLDDRLEHAIAAALEPRADNAYRNTEENTDDRQLDRRPHAAQQSAAFEVVIELDEIDAVGIMQAA